MRLILLLLVPIISFGQITGSGPISIGDIRTEVQASGAYSIGDGRAAFNLTGATSLSDFYGLTNESVSVSPPSTTANPAGQTFNVTVTATGAWEVNNKPSWITMPTSGAGSGVISITASANNTGLNRNIGLLFELVSDATINAQHSVFQFPL